MRNLWTIAVISIMLTGLNGCGSDAGLEDFNQTSPTVDPNDTRGTGHHSEADYPYIPTGAALTDRMAVKFLNMATMGSTPEMVQELRQKGVVKWVEDQIAKPWNFKKESVVYMMMYYALERHPETYCKKRNNLPIPKTEAQIDALIETFLADNTVVFDQGLVNGPLELYFHSSAIVKGNIEDDAQIRQRVAFALSQIIVASESADLFFKNKGEALSYYYDILLKGAFGNYGDLLYHVSLSPAMAAYLTYANNSKLHENPKTHTMVYPDENYGREIMQLFSIGLFELNMDGTPKRKGGRRIPSHNQKDVMEVSRVFTGLVYPHCMFPRKKRPSLWGSDALHPLVCRPDEHDSGTKHFLGETIPSGQGCYEDINATVTVLMAHENTAPFIAKKLILRLTKSNPKTAYVQRVAEVFKRSGGDLGKTVKAVLLDPEIWEDIRNDRSTKTKEPYLAYIGMLRALGVKPWPMPNTAKGHNHYYVRSRYGIINEWPTWSPSVFNFYSDDYEPDSPEFKTRGLKAPESQLLTTRYMQGIENNAYDTLRRNEYHYLYACNGYKLGHVGGQQGSYILFDFGKYLDEFKQPGKRFADGPRDAAGRAEAVRKVIEDASQRLLGKQLDDAIVQELTASHKDTYTAYPKSWNDAIIQKNLVSYIIAPLITEIVMTKEYMTH